MSLEQQLMNIAQTVMAADGVSPVDGKVIVSAGDGVVGVVDVVANTVATTATD